MKIKAYLKPHCGWSNGVRAILRKHNLPFEDIDIINNRANYAEMVQKSGQPLSPCVEVDGVMLADVSGEEVENYLLSNDLVKPTDAAIGVNLQTIANLPRDCGLRFEHWKFPGAWIFRALRAVRAQFEASRRSRRALSRAG